jgi:hypothetical protein
MSRFVGAHAQQQIAIGEDELIGTETQGISAKRVIDASLNEKVTKVGDIAYYAMAFPGASQADPVWRCKKVDATDPNNIFTTWANGSSEYTNVATDLPSLSYS